MSVDFSYFVAMATEYLMTGAARLFIALILIITKDECFYSSLTYKRCEKALEILNS